MKVTTKMQGAGGGAPVEQVWARQADDAGVMLAVAQLLQHAKDDAPWAPKVISITIEF